MQAREMEGGERSAKLRPGRAKRKVAVQEMPRRGGGTRKDCLQFAVEAGRRLFKRREGRERDAGRAAHVGDGRDGVVKKVMCWCCDAGGKEASSSPFNASIECFKPSGLIRVSGHR